jgi:hypothetical protein
MHACNEEVNWIKPLRYKSKSAAQLTTMVHSSGTRGPGAEHAPARAGGKGVEGARTRLQRQPVVEGR